MAKKSRLNELYELDIDYSIPINKFAQKVKALVNRTAREMKVPVRSDFAEYCDGSAYVSLTVQPSINFLTKVDKEIRKLAKTHKVGQKPLSLKVVDVQVGNYKIDVSFC